MKFLERYGSLIHDFNGDPVPLEGMISLLVKASTYPQYIMVQMTFLVIKLSTPYNEILGWPWLCALDVMVSIKYLMVKFPIDHGVRWLKGSQVVARQCYNARLQPEAKSDPFSIENADIFA